MFFKTYSILGYPSYHSSSNHHDHLFKNHNNPELPMDIHQKMKYLDNYLYFKKEAIVALNAKIKGT
jgi:hypothetical protein